MAAVEDGFYDAARVLANGTELWRNTASPTAPQQISIDHVDREWRFADFDLAGRRPPAR